MTHSGLSPADCIKLSLYTSKGCLTPIGGQHNSIVELLLCCILCLPPVMYLLMLIFCSKKTNTFNQLAQTILDFDKLYKIHQTLFNTLLYVLVG